jgi:hypothetical protein
MNTCAAHREEEKHSKQQQYFETQEAYDASLWLCWQRLCWWHPETAAAPHCIKRTAADLHCSNWLPAAAAALCCTKMLACLLQAFRRCSCAWLKLSDTSLASCRSTVHATQQ